MPWHPWYLGTIVHLFIRLIQCIEVLHSGIGVILARPQLTVISVLGHVRDLEARQLVVDHCMLWCVPSTKTEIDATNESDHVIHDTDLLMVSPEKGSLPDLIGRALDEDIRVQIKERELGVFRVDGYG